MERTILHCDCNNFYASVESLYNPSLKNKPMAVCGSCENRHGIVLAKNNLAKKYKVCTGETIWIAQEKCPDLVIVHPNYDRYLKYSKLCKEIYYEYTDLIEPYGLDECWLDVTGSINLFGNGKAIANKIRNKIYKELGITISVGVSFNKIFAKLGSDLKKPNATTVIPHDSFKQIIWPLPAKDLLFVGPSTNKKLSNYLIHTIGDIANCNTNFLKRILGKNGIKLWQFANGLDTSPVLNIQDEHTVKSIGNSTTTPRDLVNSIDVKIILLSLCESISYRLRALKQACTVISIDIKDNTFNMFKKQIKLKNPLQFTSDIFKIAYQLYDNYYNKNPIRSIGVHVSDLVSNKTLQLTFFDNNKTEKIENTIDTIRNKYGHFSIQRGLCLYDSNLSHSFYKTNHNSFPSF